MMPMMSARMTQPLAQASGLPIPLAAILREPLLAMRPLPRTCAQRLHPSHVTVRERGAAGLEQVEGSVRMRRDSRERIGANRRCEREVIVELSEGVLMTVSPIGPDRERFCWGNPVDAHLGQAE